MGNVGKSLLLLVMFWNLENFFDPFMSKDSLSVAGNEFTPFGEKHWTWKKFTRKRDFIAKTVFCLKEHYADYPALIGVCEVENRFVLTQLLKETPLERLNYSILHKDSPDKRGIDVALLYKADVFKVLSVKYLPDTSKIKDFTSRYILFARLLFTGNTLSGNLGDELGCSFVGSDTLNVFVTHWPSKLGGEKRSMPKRMFISNLLKAETDSLLRLNAKANIIIMGDFNDTPNSLPIRHLAQDKLHNLMGNVKGTYKYKGRWQTIDQFVVSDNLLQFVEAEAFIAPHLLEQDKRYMGSQIKRTLKGPRYNGGISDHLPIVLQIFE